MSNQNQQNSPVFEMILQSLSEEPSQFLQAKPTHKEMPVDWHKDQQEGQLAVDVGQTDSELVVISTMAGAETEKIEVYIHNDLLTIKGVRVSPLLAISGAEFFHEECFWGKFSRTIVLPSEVKADLATAEYKNGVLTIRVPKRKVDAKIPVMIVEE